MKNKKQKWFFHYLDYPVLLATFGLMIFGTFMIISAEMGELDSDINGIMSSAIKQGAFILLSSVAFIAFCSLPFAKTRKDFLYVIYGVIFLMLIGCRFFKPVGGAYAWLRFGSISIQPSEFAKLFSIIYAASTFSKNYGDKQNKKNLIIYVVGMLIYAFIIRAVQKDLGSAAVLIIISYINVLVTDYKCFRNITFGGMMIILFVIALMLLLLSDVGTAFFKKLGSHYQILRFLASANPFEYQYDAGYHLVMSLISFATGGLFGLGYGKSIHKYMNFPNPSTDFILPVVVEELGVITGLLPILIGYGILLISLMYYSFKTKRNRSRIVFVGTFTYLISHFILNVGGVSGLLPLTGVPLLFISAGGTSLLSIMSCLGLAESDIVEYRRSLDESSSRQI